MNNVKKKLISKNFKKIKNQIKFTLILTKI